LRLQFRLPVLRLGLFLKRDQHLQRVGGIQWPRRSFLLACEPEQDDYGQGTEKNNVPERGLGR
jgi:hypothetical protein